MKIDAVVERGTLPVGEYDIAALPARYAKSWPFKCLNLPNGKARCRSLYTQYNCVVLASDARCYDLPILEIKRVRIGY